MNEVWLPLASFKRGSSLAPDDIFSDLFQSVDGYLGMRNPLSKLAEITNDPQSSREAFIQIVGSDFRSELAIVQFLEEAFLVVDDYSVPGLADEYERLLEAFMRKYNVRYRVAQPFAVRFMLPGTFANLYSELQRVNLANQQLAQLLEEFEHAFDSLARNPGNATYKIAIAKASNYVEGLASATAGNPSSRNTLGALCEQLTDWPHDEIKESLKKMYKFCSDYPGIRHAGTAANASRPLALRDSTLSCLLLLSFTGYLSPSINEMTVLGR